MNLLFLTLSSEVNNIQSSGIYTDLIRKFQSENHEVYVVYPLERRLGLKTSLIDKDKLHALGVRTLNVTKTNVIEKGVGQLLLETQFKLAIKKYFSEIKFDLILYSTPPITFKRVVQYVKKNNPEALSYLLLKDIFPQNAVDIGLLSTKGIRGLLYRFFRAKERSLYAVSDVIGCMSPANVEYVLKHNPEVSLEKVEIAPNSYDLPNPSDTFEVDSKILSEFGLPSDRTIFLYGGNMGKPQGISFLIDCLNAMKDREDCHFVIVGDGTEYSHIETWFQKESPASVSLFRHLPKKDYDRLASACDVGLIFLDYRFTIPNYPSRLLPYLMGRKPIIAATDPNSDIGFIAEANDYGYWCPSNSVDAFVNCVNRMLVSDRKQMGENAYKFYLENYTVNHTYKAIVKHIK